MVKIENMLFPVDFSENADRFMPYVNSLEQRLGCRLTLLHVAPDLDTWRMQYLPPFPSPEAFREEIESRAKKRMADFCAEHLADSGSFESVVQMGDPAVEILKAVDRLKIDLVAMGTHGRKGLEHTLFGSVAENVVKRCPAPVLTINPYRVEPPPQGVWKVENLLFPVDFSEQGNRFMPYVRRFSEQFNSRVHLLHVIDDNFGWGQAYSLAWDPKQASRRPGRRRSGWISSVMPNWNSARLSNGKSFSATRRPGSCRRSRKNGRT
jgi:nucleotide-binding universal stress UspA family protein